MKLKIFIAFLLLVNLSYAQIHFEHITETNTWDVILKKAEKENKLLFVDAYAAWCGPCKFMERNIFSETQVAQYYNDNFINVSIDMETLEGQKFNEKYPIEVFPTLMYLNANGHILKKKMGAITDPTIFINTGKYAINPTLDPLVVSTKKYKAGNRDKPFLIEYIGLLLEDGQDITNEVEAYFKTVDQLSLENEDVFSLFYLQITDLSHPLMKDFLVNLDRLKEVYGGQLIFKKIITVLDENTQIAAENHDEKKLKEVILFVESAFKGDPEVQNIVVGVKDFYTHNAAQK